MSVTAPSRNLIQPNRSLYRRGWGHTRPPPGTRVDFSHPLARGFVAGFLFGSDGLREVVKGLAGTNTGTTRAPGRFGMGRKFVAAATQYIDVTPSVDLAAEFTAVSWINCADVTSTRHAAIADTDWIAGTSAAVCYVNRLTPRLAIYWRVAAGFALEGTVNITVGEWFQAVWKRTGSVGNWLAELYHDAVLEGSQATAVNPDAHSNTDIGRMKGLGTGYPMDGGIDHTFIWNRGLDAAEIVQLYNEPFAFFR